MTNMLVGDDDFSADMDAEIQQAAEESTRKKNSSGATYLFRMPKAADADGTRKATIRFRTPYKNGIKILEHSKWGDFQMVCPAEFGLGCQVCKKLVAKHKLKDRAALLENLLLYTKGEDITTRFIRAWQVWHYEARDGKGGNYLFAFPINQTSPINPIHAMNRTRAVLVEEPDVPLIITDYDILLTQYKEGKDRSFTSDNKTSTPRLFKHMDESPEWTKEEMKFGYAISISRDNKEWLEKLQKLREAAVADGRIPLRTRVEESKHNKSVADELDELLLFDEESEE